MRASSGAFTCRSFQPARIFTVTGIFTAFTIAATMAAACSGSRIRLHPALCFAIFGTGHPMLTSTMSAPRDSTACAAAAMRDGSPPKIWIETGRSSSVNSRYSSERPMPRTSASDDTISETTRPQAPCRFTRRRKAESVMPAMGATPIGDDISVGIRDSGLGIRGVTLSRRMSFWLLTSVFLLTTGYWLLQYFRTSATSKVTATARLIMVTERTSFAFGPLWMSRPLTP